MKPSIINYSCSHPQFVACSLGAIALNICAYWLSFGDIMPFFVFTDLVTAICFIVFLLANGCLGMFGGMLFIWPFLRPLFSSINASSVSIGDEVMVLSGSSKGMIAKVSEFVIGQGGWKLARLDCVSNVSGDSIFEVYSIFKIGRTSNENH